MVVAHNNHTTKYNDDYDYETFNIKDLQFFPSSILVKRSFDERDNRQTLSSSTLLPETFYIQFDSMNKRFVIESIENINLSKELSNSTNVKFGKSLIGIRMIVEDLSTGKHEEFSDPIVRLYYDPINKYLNGGLFLNNQWYQIQDLMAEKSTQLNSMMIQTKKLPTLFKCAHDQAKFNREGALNYHADKLLQSKNKKRLEARLAADGGGCPGYRKAIYIGVVADCHFLKKHGGDQSKALASVIGEFNIVSGIFERNLNIEICLGSVELMRECGDSVSGGHGSSKSTTNTNSAKSKWNSPSCDPSYSMDERLSDFSKWRGDKKDGSLGLYHLMSGCPGYDVVGIAWLNQVCQTKATWSSGEYVSGTSVSLSVPNRAYVIAHEMGHNFGATHDCDSITCAMCNNGKDERECKCCPCNDVADGGKCDCKSNYLMNAESGGLSLQNFSYCSKKDICGKLPVLAGCLEKPGSHRSISKSICGNGIKEEGEECDCGDECDSDPCCQEGCKLRSNAQCSFRNDDCCTEKCKIVSSSANKQCRKRENDCQLNAYCDGKSSVCPEEKFLPDGTECFDTNEVARTSNNPSISPSPSPSPSPSSDTLQSMKKKKSINYCASGICTNRDLQCQAIGLRSGIKASCPWNTYECKITCSASSNYFSSSSSLFSNEVSCVTFESYFVNGTRCGKSGYCRNGKCSVSEWSEFFKESNSSIWIIGLIGGVIVAILFIGIVNWLVRKINK